MPPCHVASEYCMHVGHVKHDSRLVVDKKWRENVEVSGHWIALGVSEVRLEQVYISACSS